MMFLRRWLVWFVWFVWFVSRLGPSATVTRPKNARAILFTALLSITALSPVAIVRFTHTRLHTLAHLQDCTYSHTRQHILAHVHVFRQREGKTEKEIDAESTR